MTDQAERPLLWLVEATRTLEGGGFPVRRPFPTAELDHVDPFLLIDEMGPVTWPPGEAIGAPDHPHRGFETVTYVLAGRHQHKDSQGNSGILETGDVQWMTAGAGVVHSEMPEEAFRQQGGTMHGFQIWVNLPARDKMMKPRYQELPAERIPQGISADGDVTVRVIAGRALGAEAAIETRTPIMLLHFTLQPGAETVVEVPTDHNAMAYVFRNDARLGPELAPAPEGSLGVFGEGATLRLGGPAEGTAATDLLLLTGAPLKEPVARYGPFVMNTREELVEAFNDFQAGHMGNIAPDLK